MVCRKSSPRPLISISELFAEAFHFENNAFRSGLLARLAPVLLVFLILAVRVDAGEIEPRAYGNAPVGVNFLIAGYAHSEGGLATEVSSPLKDAVLGLDFALLAYARSFELLGKAGKVDVILPCSDMSGSALVAGEYRERNVSGFSDPKLRLSVNFVGAPVLSVQEFAGWQQDLIVGASIQVSPPLGQYDPDRMVNLGSNRWFVRPDIGISKAWGDFVLELSTGVIFFADNNEYYGGRNLEQNPVSVTQAHVIYTFGRGVWGAVSWVCDYGGRTKIDGVRNDDEQSNSRVGAMFSMPVNRNNSIKIFSSTGVITRYGTEYDLAGISWQYRWGNGL
jgi:hypothetical protein